MSLWKVYQVEWDFIDFYPHFKNWDGKFTEAKDIQDAINVKTLEQRRQHRTDKDKCYYAVPEGWELPLEFYYEQLELF
jgi:hypothetical protein